MVRLVRLESDLGTIMSRFSARHATLRDSGLRDSDTYRLGHLQTRSLAGVVELSPEKGPDGSVIANDIPTLLPTVALKWRGQKLPRGLGAYSAKLHTDRRAVTYSSIGRLSGWWFSRQVID